MAMDTFLSSFLDRLETTGNVQSASGEPIQLGHKTMNPLARSGYGFGGGFSQGKGQEPDGGGAGVNCLGRDVLVPGAKLRTHPHLPPLYPPIAPAELPSSPKLRYISAFYPTRFTV